MPTNKWGDEIADDNPSPSPPSRPSPPPSSPPSPPSRPSAPHNQPKQPPAANTPQQQSQSRSRNRSAVEYLSVAAVLARTVVAPLERTKLLLQLENDLLKYKRIDTPYRGILDCMSRTIKSDGGVVALWRGHLPIILRTVPGQALSFYTIHQFKQILVPPRGAKPQERMYYSMAAGALSALVMIPLLYPLEYAHTRLAADVGDNALRQFRGMRDVITRTAQHDGIRGLYRGFGVSFLGAILYRGAYFGLYDTIRPMMKTDNPVAKFALGWTITLSAGLVVYPADTVQRRMMMRSLTGEPFAHSIEALRTILRQEGPRALWKGGATSIARSLSSAVFLAVYDFVSSNMAH